MIKLPPTLDPDKVETELVRTYHLRRQETDLTTLPTNVLYGFIVFTHRSGSFYLADLLLTTRYLNHAQECLNPGKLIKFLQADEGGGTYGDYFSNYVWNSTKNAVCLAKVTIHQLAFLAWYGILNNIISSSKFIVIERMDKLGQAISHSIANQTGKFQWFDKPEREIAPAYNYSNILTLLESITSQVMETGRFMGLNGLVPHHVSYEALVANPALVVARVVDFLGVDCGPVDLGRVAMLVQRTSVNDDWRGRFLAEDQTTALPDC